MELQLHYPWRNYMLEPSYRKPKAEHCNIYLKKNKRISNTEGNQLIMRYLKAI